MAVSDCDTITVVRDMGLVTDGLRRAHALWSLRGICPSGIPATPPRRLGLGGTPQPVFRAVGRAGFALGHNGNLTNTAALAEKAGMLPAWSHRDRQ